MTNQFQKLKETAVEQFERLRQIMRPNLGTHKHTRLTQAGCGLSNSLLHDQVASRHAELMNEDLTSWFGMRSEQDQLRFLTILHAVTPLDKKATLRSVGEMERFIYDCLTGTGVLCLGATEVEIVNLKLLEDASGQGQNQARKLAVLQRLLDPSGSDAGMGVLIHFHGVLDLSNSILHEAELRERLHRVEPWHRSPFQIEMKAFFRNRPLGANLRKLAEYMTKGGNDTLRYNLSFGRDTIDELDAQLWRGGMGRADRGAETITDPRSLNFAEIDLLDQIWISLMTRRNDNRGYAIQISDAPRQ